jgi:hypothetical protein
MIRLNFMQRIMMYKLYSRVGKVETLYGVLAKYGGARYSYKPDPNDDMFYKNSATKVIYKQKKAFKPVKLNYIDYVANIHIWEVYTDNLQTNEGLSCTLRE